MKFPPLHSWDLTPKEAVALQRELASRVDSHPSLANWDLVAGADASYSRFSKIFFGGIVVIRTSDWSVVECQGAVREVLFPYVPGILSFREAPALLDAFAKLKSKPDAIIVDGAGVGHPRRFGLASHLGLWLDLPCVGCAKSRLIGTFEKPGKEAGSLSPLMDKEEIIGSVVRTRKGVKPLFVSVGNHINLTSAVQLVLGTCRGYRLPEPIRKAHDFVNELRRNAQE